MEGRVSKHDIFLLELTAEAAESLLFCYLKAKGNKPIQP